jgi:hypothetical protein
MSRDDAFANPNWRIPEEKGAVDVKNGAGLRFFVQQTFCSAKFE